MSIHDGYTKKQLDEMENNKWTQQKIEDAEWKIMDDKSKLRYLDRVIAEEEKEEIRKEIRKDIQKDIRKEIKQDEKNLDVFIPPDSSSS
ncbi:hypothetical protein OAP76_00665 [Alphaproteobacteria bacterium]|nr:hypothetical protein [Alphaproteobacteria bacterium]